MYDENENAKTFRAPTADIAETVNTYFAKAMERRLRIQKREASFFSPRPRPFKGFLNEYLVEETDDGTCEPAVNEDIGYINAEDIDEDALNAFYSAAGLTEDEEELDESLTFTDGPSSWATCEDECRESNTRDPLAEMSIRGQIEQVPCTVNGQPVTEDADESDYEFFAMPSTGCDEHKQKLDEANDGWVGGLRNEKTWVDELITADDLLAPNDDRGPTRATGLRLNANGKLLRHDRPEHSHPSYQRGVAGRNAAIRSHIASDERKEYMTELLIASHRESDQRRSEEWAKEVAERENLLRATWALEDAKRDARRQASEITASLWRIPISWR